MADLQIDLNALSRWCKVNGINSNTDKTKVMFFGSKPGLPPYEVQFDNTPLSVVTSYKCEQPRGKGTPGYRDLIF